MPLHSLIFADTGVAFAQLNPNRVPSSFLQRLLLYVALDVFILLSLESDGGAMHGTNPNSLGISCSFQVSG